ncbi:rhodanese-like domain-containing protein [Kribbella sp. VKM Ac-2571]|uniref:rhodanese-like domain-containing protein n=1 Tax=Kribbella sp. VKM Ac-2571 TaxID=2512222 RepID=UPI0035181A22
MSGDCGPRSGSSQSSPHCQVSWSRSECTRPIRPRNHLERRLDPTSTARIPEAVTHDIQWIVICEGGYSSSLAARSLRELGLFRSADVIGGFQAWQRARLPVTH